MKFTNFNNGLRHTVGAELELRLLHAHDLSLANEFDFIASKLNDTYKKNITPEYLQCLVEINTPIFTHPKNLSQYIERCIGYLQSIAASKKLLLSSSGSYALGSQNVQISQKKRYDQLHEEHQILLENFTICGMHVHIGFETFDEALKAYNFSLKYLPLFLALSASSVFYDNQFTGIDSYRTKIFDRLPKSSIPDYFESYDHMKSMYDLLEKTDVIQTQKDVWWDLRIQPDLQTLEFRICDAVNDYDRIEAIVALVQGVCRLSEVQNVEKLPLQILKQNMWSATRYSMNGHVIFNDTKYSIKEALALLSDELIEKGLLDIQSHKKVKQYINKDSIAQQMKTVYEKTDALCEVEKIGVFK
jgi:carboxylate-amine ligase